MFSSQRNTSVTSVDTTVWPCQCVCFHLFSRLTWCWPPGPALDASPQLAERFLGPQKAKQLPDFVSGYNRTLRSELGGGSRWGVNEGTDVHPHPLVPLLLHTLACKCPVSWLREDAHGCLGQRFCGTWVINTRLLFRCLWPYIVFSYAEVFCRQLWLIARWKNNKMLIILMFCFCSESFLFFFGGGNIFFFYNLASV